MMDYRFKEKLTVDGGLLKRYLDQVFVVKKLKGLPESYRDQFYDEEMNISMIERSPTR